MPVIEPVVSESKLRDLLDEGHESPGLDYKQSLDPNDTRAWVELAKDVGAMQAEGGFIVIGADDHGTPVGVSQGDLAKFDESRLRSKLTKWIAEPFDLRSAAHNIGGRRVVVIFVGAREDGFCVFEADGQHSQGIAFRAGDVYVRHGTASERWSQADVKQIRARLLQRERHEERVRIYEVVHPRTLNVAGQCDGLLLEMIKAAGLPFAPETITSQELEQVCRVIDPNGTAPLIIGGNARAGWQHATWIGYMWHQRQRSREFDEDVRVFAALLEAEHLKHLARIEQCSLFAQLRHLVVLRPGNSDCSWLSSSMWDYLEAARALKHYATTTLSRYKAP